MTIKTDNIQIGNNATATQNFTLKQGADGTCTLSRGNVGATTQDIITVDASGYVATPAGSKNLTLMTAQATTSGTSIDFTGIPAWVKRITLMLNGVSTNGTSLVRVQLGTAGAPEITGYSGTAGTMVASTGVSALSAGFDISDTGTAARILNGSAIFNLQQANIWSGLLILGLSNEARLAITGGTKSLSGTLNMIRITTVNGTDAFDAGSVNVMYEG